MEVYFNTITIREIAQIRELFITQKEKQKEKILSTSMMVTEAKFPPDNIYLKLRKHWNCKCSPN